MRDDHPVCRRHRRCFRGRLCDPPVRRDRRDHPDRRRDHLVRRRDHLVHRRVRRDHVHDHRNHPVHRVPVHGRGSHHGYRGRRNRDVPVRRVQPDHRVHDRAWSRGWGAGHRARPRAPDPSPNRCRRGCCPAADPPAADRPAAGRQVGRGEVRRRRHRCRRGCCPAADRRAGVLPPERREQVGRAEVRPPERQVPQEQRAGRAGRRGPRALAVRPPARPQPSSRWSSWPLPSWPASERQRAWPRPGAELPVLRWWRRRNGRTRPFPAIWQGRPCSRLRAL